MSEILIYKANECTSKLDEATEIVNAEIHRLDHNADSAFEKVNARFQAALDAIGEWIDNYYTFKNSSLIYPPTNKATLLK